MLHKIFLLPVIYFYFPKLKNQTLAHAAMIEQDAVPSVRGTCQGAFSKYGERNMQLFLLIHEFMSAQQNNTQHFKQCVSVTKSKCVHFRVGEVRRGEKRKQPAAAEKGSEGMWRL